MLTSLDYLVITAGIIIFAAVLSIILMFALKNKKAGKVFFYIAVLLGFYTAVTGFYLFNPDFSAQSAKAILTAVLSILAIIFERFSKNKPKFYTYARVLALVAVIGGTLNLFS